MAGPDICGFFFDTTDDLCGRWLQLGTLYPFSRNHNHEKNTDQALYQMNETIRISATKNINFRYQILNYYYSLYFLTVFQSFSSNNFERMESGQFTSLCFMFFPLKLNSMREK